MTLSDSLKRYTEYINLIEANYLKKFFEIQKPYIHCKEGCSACCEIGEYPVSEIELMYMVAGYKTLPEDLQSEIIKNADKIKQERPANSNEVYLYKCPFLLNKKCAIYNYRAIICRTHGLLFYITDKSGKTHNKMPACVSDGLNYSEVYDPVNNTISPEMWAESKIPVEPKAYNISREVIMSNAKNAGFDIAFGESKALIDWF